MSWSTPPNVDCVNHTGEVVKGDEHEPAATQSAASPLGVNYPPVIVFHIEAVEYTPTGRPV